MVVARRRLESAARAAGGVLAEIAVPSASARTIVYKGLVTGGRLPDLYPDLRAPLSVGYTVFHQRYATNTHPVWRLAQPFRSIAHNGEINTVRGNREQVRGRSGDATLRDRAALLAAGPLLSADGSDSLALDEALELLTSTGWDLTPALLTAIPEALGLRRAPHPHVATFRRRTAGFLAPWDGPAAIVFADGPGSARWSTATGSDRRPSRSRRTSGGGRIRGRRRPVQRGRDGPPRTARPRRAAPRRARPAGHPRGCRGEGPGPPGPADPRCRPADVEDRIAPSAATARRGGAPRSTDHVMRYLAGLDAERARLDIKTMALEGHEPLWSMGDDTPTPGRGRLDRPVADHLRQAFAQVTNPAIDPERERIVMDLRVELGRRPALLGGPPRSPRTIASGDRSSST